MLDCYKEDLRNAMALNGKTFPHNSDLTTLRRKPFKINVGKGENASYRHFLLVPTIFSTLPNTNFNYSVTIMSSSITFNLKWSILLLFGKS